MTYKKNKERCQVAHPNREGVKCWGNHDPGEAHWSVITDQSSVSGIRRITWRI